MVMIMLSRNVHKSINPILKYFTLPSNTTTPILKAIQYYCIRNRAYKPYHQPSPQLFVPFSLLLVPLLKTNQGVRGEDTLPQNNLSLKTINLGLRLWHIRKNCCLPQQAFHISTIWCLNCSTSNPAPCQCTWEREDCTCTHVGDTDEAPATSPVCCSHLGSEPQDERSFSFK